MLFHMFEYYDIIITEHQTIMYTKENDLDLLLVWTNIIKLIVKTKSYFE